MRLSFVFSALCFPELLDIVVLALFSAHYVDNYILIIDEDPLVA